MNQQTLTTEIKTHVVMLSTGTAHYISQRIYDLVKTATGDTWVDLDDGNGFKVSAVMDTLTVDNYEKQHKDAKAEAGVRATQKPLESFEDIVEAFQPLGAKFHFNNMLELVVKTHRAMTEWHGDFKQFCIKHKALTMDGRVCTGKYYDTKGIQRTAVFAYPFFCAVKKLIDDRKRKQEFAEEKSWEEITAAGQL